MARELLTGIYRHYKGPLYEVAGYAHDANAPHERELVLYRGLQLDGAKMGPRWSVRDAEQEDGFAPRDAFFDSVCQISTCPHFGDLASFESCTPQHYGPRFEYLGPVLTADMVR